MLEQRHPGPKARASPTKTPASTHKSTSVPWRSRRTAGTGRQGRTGQRQRDKLSSGRDPLDACPSQLRNPARRVPLCMGGKPIFFAMLPSLSSETGFNKFVSEEFATVCARHTSRRRRIPMSTSPRHRARCGRHEARAGIFALTSCSLVRLSIGGLGFLDDTVFSLPACTRRSLRRGAAFASRLDPLLVSGDECGRSKPLIFAVLNGTSFTD